MKTRDDKEFDLREVKRTIKELEDKKAKGQIDPIEADAMIAKAYERKAELEIELGQEII